VSRNRNKPLYENITISDLGAEGKSLAKVGEKVVFTDHAVPGDVVDLQVTVCRRRYEEARVVRYHRYSAVRAEPFCDHFGLCGGCKWQNLPYEKQLFYKQKQVEDQLRRIGKLELPPLMPILGSSDTLFYRNKLEFSFSNNRWLSREEMEDPRAASDRDALGFHVPGMFYKVFRVEKCWLQPEPSNAIRNFIFHFAREEGYAFYDIRGGEGFLRSLIIRNSTEGEVMVILSFFRDQREERERVLNALRERFPEITSLMYVINNKGNDTITDREVCLYSGKDHITESMEGLRFRIGPKSFFQTNSRQALELYRKVREFSSLKGDETVYDLYSGTGTISLFLARHCKKVIGLEYVKEATEDAWSNARFNGINNATFYTGDIKTFLKAGFPEQEGSPEVVITDPPRSGMHEDVVMAIAGALPARIVYVSCNPATQARDMALLDPYYRVEKIQPLDMFPHTHHVENIALLVRRVDPRDHRQEPPEAENRLLHPFRSFPPSRH